MKKIAIAMAAATLIASGTANASYVADDWGATPNAGANKGKYVGLCGDDTHFPSPFVGGGGIPRWLPCFYM